MSKAKHIDYDKVFVLGFIAVIIVAVCGFYLWRWQSNNHKQQEQQKLYTACMNEREYAYKNGKSIGFTCNKDGTKTTINKLTTTEPIAKAPDIKASADNQNDSAPSNTASSSASPSSNASETQKIIDQKNAENTERMRCYDIYSQSYSEYVSSRNGYKATYDANMAKINSDYDNGYISLAHSTNLINAEQTKRRESTDAAVAKANQTIINAGCSQHVIN